MLSCTQFWDTKMGPNFWIVPFLYKNKYMYWVNFPLKKEKK